MKHRWVYFEYTDGGTGRVVLCYGETPEDCSRVVLMSPAPMLVDVGASSSRELAEEVGSLVERHESPGRETYKEVFRTIKEDYSRRHS